MPTVRQNIRYACDELMRAHGDSVRHLAKSLIIIVLIALALECFLFNINFYLSAGYNTIDLTGQLELQQTDDGQYKLTSVDDSIEFSNLNTEVHNIHIDFDSDQPAQLLTLSIHFTDEAHSTYFDSTEYTVGIPEVDVSTYSSQSEYINLNATGLVDNLLVEVVGDDVSYPITITSVSINAHHPFNFNVGRFLATLGILLLAFVFRPNSAIYRIDVVSEPKKSKAGIIFAVLVEMCLMSGFLFYGSNLVGVATSSYNYGSWDGESLVNTFEVGGDNAQQYAELAKAFTEGQLYLDEEPPEWLQELDDPYDKGARDEAQKETGEEYLFDVCYYEGHYYVYFGVVPCLLYHLPFYLLTGENFPTAIGVLISVLAFVLGCSALLDRFARYHFKHVSLGLYLLLQIPLVMCCGVLYLLKFPTFYSLPIATALAFSVWGLYFWMRGRTAKNREGWFLAGSFCMALVLGCRPQFLVLSLLAFPLFWRPYVTERRLFTARGAREFICLIAPYFVVAAGIMWYNCARFGSPLDFGANYNLTLDDMTQRGWNIGRLAPALFSYFLQPMSTTGVFPFIQAASFDTTYMGQTVKEVTFGGILSCLPILWVLFFSAPILQLRSKQRSTHTVMGVVIALLVGGVVVALVDAEMAGILQRYYSDFSFMFLIAAVLLIFVANENLERGSKTQRMLLNALIVLVALSVLYSVLICFVPETGWYSDVYPWAYQGLLEAVQFWT